MCLALGKTKKQLLRELNSQDITEWIAYNRIEPFGQEQLWLMAGTICAVLANINKSKGTPPFKASDFIPPSFKAKPTGKKQSVAEMKHILESMGAKKIKKEREK